MNKSKFFRPFVEKAFKNVPGFKLLTESDPDALFKGFYFTYVYKDFILREVIQRINVMIPVARERNLLAQIERDYSVFMEVDLTSWARVLLEINWLVNYQGIVPQQEIGRAHV